MTRTRTTMTTPSDAGLCRGLTAPISAPPSVTLRLSAGRSVLDQPRPGRNDDEDENHDDDAFGRRAVPGIDCTDIGTAIRHLEAERRAQRAGSAAART